MRTLTFTTVLMLLSGGGTALSAQPAPTYEACYVPSVGAIYLLNRPGLPTACLSEAHIAVTWTDGGDLADGAVTEAKLAFDPTTQAELDGFIAGLAAAGTINADTNPVEWTQLRNVPADLADGVDDTGGTPSDLACTGCVDAADLADGVVAGTKLAVAAVDVAHLAFDPTTQAELDAVTTGLAAAGTINAPTNPVNWTQLVDVPEGLADGVDNDGGTPADLACTGCVGTTDLADAAVTGVQLADGTVTEAELAFDPTTQAELDVVTSRLAAPGTINARLNPVSWTQLMNVPAGLADGVDEGGVVDHAALTGLGVDDHPQYLLVGARAAPNGFAVTGTAGSGTIPATGVGVRLMWYPGRAAFRAGRTAGSEWDDANVGASSMAFGEGTTARGSASVAMGNGTSALGFFSTAMGSLTTANGRAATAMGVNTVASGDSAVAMGGSTVASGIGSTAMGGSTVASGIASTAMGAFTTASSQSSTAMGRGTTASGPNSTAMGYLTTARGVASTAMGNLTTTDALASLVIGQLNLRTGSQTEWVDTDPLFVAGNGTSQASNALTLLKNGNLTIAGTLTQNSDIRLKEDIEPLEPALEALLALTPIRYRFRAGTGHPTEPQIGLSAQEVERAFPELVTEDSEGHLSVAYANLTAVLVRAVQEQTQKMQEQRAETDGLLTLIQQRDSEARNQRTRIRQMQGQIDLLRAEIEALRAALPPGPVR